MTENTFLQSALQYIKMGFSVFPVKPKGKEPITAHGCRDASADSEQIKAWWRQFPDANIGLAMGRGFIAIDLDVDEDKGVNGYHVLCDWQRENGELPDTILSITGRGGYHMIYRTDRDFKNAVGLYEGVDVRSNGGYIIAPPSIHPNGNFYEWEQSPDEYQIAQADILVEQFLQGEKQTQEKEYFQAPEMIPEGTRNATLYKMACSLRAKGYAESAIFAAVKAENEAKCNPSLSDREIDTIVKSALKYESGTGADPKCKEDRKPGKLDAFHLFNDKGRITGVFDFAIFEYIKKNYDIFVLGGTPYLYENGVFTADDTGAKLKTMIRKLIYPEFIKSTTVKRIYELFLADAELEISFEDINQYPAQWINFQNGFLDPKTGQIIEHSPRYRAINQIPHKYRKDCPEGEAVEKWLQFICENAEDREMLLQFAGYCLTRDVSQQKFLVLYGEGGSGKSTVIRMIEEMTGCSNVSNISLSELQQRFASFGLMGKLMNSCADLEITALEDTAIIKKILGEDSLRAEQKGKDAISFKSYAKLIFSTNELPLVKAEKSNGFYRRLLVLPMNKVPKQKNVDLFTILSGQLDYFIWLSIEALQKMYEAGTITESVQSIEAVNQLRCDSDTVQAFIVESCTLDRSRRTERGTLYRKYTIFCEDNERKPLKKTSFFKSIRVKGFVEMKSNGAWYFEGISAEKKAPELPLQNSLDGFQSLEGFDQSEIPFD